MKISIIPKLFLISMLFLGCSNEHTKNDSNTATQQYESVDNFEYSFKSAHPKAQALMTEEFYWNPGEETAPFGSDDGWDAAYGFRQWRLTNKTTSPVSYLKETIKRWQYPFFDYNEIDTAKINEYVNKKANLDEAAIQQQIQTIKEIKQNSPGTSMKLNDTQLREVIISSSNSMGGLYLLGQDNAIIGTGFAQFVLEGRIDDDIKGLTITAIKRQLLPLLINRYDESYRNKRKEQLTKMLAVISKATS